MYIYSLDDKQNKRKTSCQSSALKVETMKDGSVSYQTSK